MRAPGDGQGYLRLPDNWRVTLVDDDDRLGRARQLLDDAYICALDAEWQPGVKPAKATLIQLAVRTRGKASHGDIDRHVLLLDLLNLRASPVRAVLQQLFRCKSTLKVGFGLVMDLWAIASSVGSEGQNCVAVVDPQVDMGTLHRHLSKHCPRNVGKVVGNGLSALVETVLGQPLDKQLQCSAWARRPLMPEQVAYAALDAACLVLLLEHFVAAVQPRLYPIGTESADALSAGLGAVQLAIDEKAEPSPEAQVACAAQAWGCRLDVCAQGRAVRPRRSSVRRLPKGVDPDLGFPAYIPWREAGSRAEGGGTPRFLCDVMTEGLARQLRLCGIDVLSVSDRGVSPTLQDHRFYIYRQLVEHAHQGGRVILTADLTFVRSRYSDSTYWVRGSNKREQLAEVLEAFDIVVTDDALLSRCAMCNGNFIPRPFGPDELPPGCEVPAGVRARVREFWLCASCGKAYWQGHLFAAAKHHLAERLRMSTAQLLAEGEGHGCHEYRPM